MTTAEARHHVLSAAGMWLDEIQSYIIPGVRTEEEREHYRAEATDITEALTILRDRKPCEACASCEAGGRDCVDPDPEEEN